VESVVAQVEALPAHEVPQEPGTALIEAPVLVRPVKDTKGSKAPSKTRRKLQLDDELEALPKPKKKKARQSGGLEDTFIFGLKPKKRQPKSKLKETIEEEPTHEETENVPAPPKRKRTAKAKQQAKDEPCEKNAGEPNEEVVALEGKPQKRKGKPASKYRADALPVDTEPLEEERLPTTTGADPVENLKSEDVVTKRPQAVSKVTKPKATAKNSAKRTIEEATENETATEPEPTTKRPRRQAATSAMAKVTLGYEEDLVPVDNLRRAPEPLARRGRPKKTTAAEVAPVLLPSPPQSVSKLSAEDEENCGEDEVPVAKVRAVGRPRKLVSKMAKIDEKEVVATSSRPSVKTPALENSHHVAKTETPVAKAPPVKRARKVRAQAVAQDVSTDNEPAKQICEVDQKRSRASKAPPLKTSRKAASKAVKPVDIIDENVAVIENVPEPPEIIIQETQESHDTIKNSSRGDKVGEPKTKSRRALAESDVNIVRSLPPDDLGVIVKPTTVKQQQPSRKTKLQQSKSTPTIDLPHDEVITPRKRHVIAADEDLDWLFEKSENKRSRVPARNPRASSKANRQAPGKKTSADAKDMDLDDLLESIADFSGKLLTGKGGRAMASK
jgi:hypothetical protein